MTWTLVGPIGTTNHSLYRCSECTDVTEGGVFHVEPKLCGVCAMQALNKQLEREIGGLRKELQLGSDGLDILEAKMHEMKEALESAAEALTQLEPLITVLSKEGAQEKLEQVVEDKQLLDLLDECGTGFYLSHEGDRDVLFEPDPVDSQTMRDLLRGAPAALEALGDDDVG